MIPYLKRELIRNHASEAQRLYEQKTGRPITYPLNVEDFFYTLFELETVYDTDGKLNGIGEGIIGCLFPEGHPSPFGGKDKIIVVNLTPCPGFDPTRFNERHTVGHEGMGHYILHFLKGVTGKKIDGPSYCRTKAAKDPLEWQADFAAGELIAPEDKITWLLDGKGPGDIVNVEIYEKNYREFFGANRAMMEARLKTLGYKLLNAKYEWADYVEEQRKRDEFLQKQREAKTGFGRRSEKRSPTDKGFMDFDFSSPGFSFDKPIFDFPPIDFSSIFGEKPNLGRGWKGKLDREMRAAMWRARRKK